MRIAQAAVDDNRRGLAVFARAGVSQDFVVERKGLDLAIDHKGQSTAHGRRVLNDGQRVEVVELILGRQGTAVARIGEAFQAVLVAIIDRGHTREGHLHERRQPKTALGQTHRVIVQAPFAALALGQL